MEEVHYCRRPEDVRVFPGAAAALESVKAAGWRTLVITNQSGIGSGRITPAEYEAVDAEFRRQLGGALDAVYFCPDPSDRPSPRRKPGIGMLEEAQAEWEIDLARCWMIGDKAIDIQCGRRAGCRTILVETGYGKSHLDAGADLVVPDVIAALDYILNNP